MEEEPNSNSKKRNIFDSYHMANKRRSITNQETYRRKQQLEPNEEQLELNEEPATFSSVERSNEVEHVHSSSLDVKSPGYFNELDAEEEENELEKVRNQKLKEEICSLIPLQNKQFSINIVARSMYKMQMYEASRKHQNDMAINAASSSDLTVGEFSKKLNGILSSNNVQSKLNND